MKISEISDEQIKEYCGLSEDVTNLTVYKASAKAFIMGYTGLTSEEIDTHEDLIIAFFVLINDMSCNRDYTVNRNSLNPCVQTILGMYSKNNIG
jgi:hypothetical protein